jgi:hypothetical protein
VRPADEEATRFAGARAAAESWLTAGGLRRSGVAACVLAACTVLVIYYPRTIQSLDRRADENSSLSFQDRAIAGGNGVVVTQDALVYARAVIPRDASYQVVVGPNLPDQKRQFLAFVPDFFRYYLMPRRPSNAPSWIVCYGCERSRLGDRFQVVADIGEGIAIGRLRR